MPHPLVKSEARKSKNNLYNKIIKIKWGTLYEARKNFISDDALASGMLSKVSFTAR